MSASRLPMALDQLKCQLRERSGVWTKDNWKKLENTGNNWLMLKSESAHFRQLFYWIHFYVRVWKISPVWERVVMDTRWNVLYADLAPVEGLTVTTVISWSTGSNRSLRIFFHNAFVCAVFFFCHSRTGMFLKGSFWGIEFVEIMFFFSWEVWSQYDFQRKDLDRKRILCHVIPSGRPTA